MDKKQLENFIRELADMPFSLEVDERGTQTCRPYEETAALLDRFIDRARTLVPMPMARVEAI